MCSGSVRDAFGLRSDQFRTKIFGAKISKMFSLCGRRRRGGGPLATVPSPAAQRAPAAAATATQIENFGESFGENHFLAKVLAFCFRTQDKTHDFVFKTESKKVFFQNWI